MDHEDIRELLETAAVEPAGLERLMAGDTTEAAAVAGHIAGCESCAAELERLRRSVPLLRDVVRTTPAPDLRERTLAFVAARGVARDGSKSMDATSDVSTSPSSDRHPRSEPRPPWRWLAAIAAAVVISVVATSIFFAGRTDQRVADRDRVIVALGNVISSGEAISTAPDATRVTLAAADGSAARGSLLYSPSTGQLVVVADGLDPEPDDQEYWCWVETDGVRQQVGRMYLVGELGYWAGQSPVMTEVPAGSTFGVSLSPVPESGVQSDPVLLGAL